MRREGGYILATALLLLAVLSVLGSVAYYKAVLGQRAAKVAGDYGKARSIAEAGLSQLFWYWTQAQDNAANCPSGDPGCMEREKVVKWVLGGGVGAPPAPMDPALYGESLADLERRAGGNLDAYIRASRNIRVYQFQRDASGMPVGMKEVPASSWADPNVKEPQVAVWVTSYKQPTDPRSYPYGDANAGCTGGDCRLVVYALGRDGDARVLMRESQGYFTSELTGVTAITNAPPYSNWNDLCNLTNGSAVGAALSWSGGKGSDDVLVEATQAPYVLGDIPSGTALSSNTNMGVGGKMFRNGTGSTSELTMDSVPVLAYSTHRTNPGVRVERASTPMDATAPPLDDPYPVPALASKLLRPGLAATPDKIRYFDVAANGQLFNIDIYRWAAEQFTCQNPATAGLPSDPYANGAYCDRAEKLRQIMWRLYPPLDPTDTGPPPAVTGRITAEDFWRNIRDGRPMFGIVRVMYPTKPKQTNVATCASFGNQPVTLYDVVKQLNNITAGASATFGGRTVSIDNRARLIVYGMLLLDYFYDVDGDFYFDADAERSILPIESTDAYLKIEVPMLINPALPRDTTGSDLWPFPTVATTTTTHPADPGVFAVENAGGGAGCTTCRNIANLAAPVGGWFPPTEGLLKPPGMLGAWTHGRYDVHGMQALMDPNRGTNGLIGWAVSELLTAPALPPALGTSTPSWNSAFNAMRNRLNYYYELLYTTTDPSKPQYWPISPSFPRTLADSFCIGAEDCTAGNHDGDKLHLFFPSGYVHGWKVALAVLNMRAEEWNGILRGVVCTPIDATSGPISCAPRRSIAELARMHQSHGIVPYGDPWAPLGAPMGQEIRLGRDPTTNAVVQLPFDLYSDASQNQGDEERFFHIRPDPSRSGYGVIDATFLDLPSLAYSGGILDTHTSNNVSGIVYTPSALEWETGNKGGIGYINGAVITGLGMYNKAGGGKAHQIYVFDPQAVDNINTNNTATIMLRFDWQVLH